MGRVALYVINLQLGADEAHVVDNSVVLRGRGDEGREAALGRVAESSDRESRLGRVSDGSLLVEDA